MLRVSFNILDNAKLYFNQFLLVFASSMFRGALINLKSYIYRKHSLNPLEIRLLEYQRIIYLKAISDAPHELKILKAVLKNDTNDQQVSYNKL